jgi:hypothetical protein
MLIEHSFVTTLDMPAAMSHAAAFLAYFGFKVQSFEAGRLEAIRGRVRATAARVVQLPQTVHLIFDRGRVTIAASIQQRTGDGLPAHAQLMTALVRGLERLLAHQLPFEQAANELRQVEAADPKHRTGGDYVVYGFLILLGVGLLIGLIALIVAVTRK